MAQCRSPEVYVHSVEAHPLDAPLSTTKQFTFRTLCHCLKPNIRKRRIVSRLLAQDPFLLFPYFVKDVRSARFRFADPKYVHFRKSRSRSSRPLQTKPSSQSRTFACSRNLKLVTAISPKPWSSRRRPRKY